MTRSKEYDKGFAGSCETQENVEYHTRKWIRERGICLANQNKLCKSTRCNDFCFLYLNPNEMLAILRF